MLGKLMFLPHMYIAFCRPVATSWKSRHKILLRLMQLSYPSYVSYLTPPNHVTNTWSGSFTLQNSTLQFNRMNVSGTIKRCSLFIHVQKMTEFTEARKQLTSPSSCQVHSGQNRIWGRGKEDSAINAYA